MFFTKFRYTVLSKMLKIMSDANEKDKKTRTAVNKSKMKKIPQIFHLLLNLGYDPIRILFGIKMESLIQNRIQELKIWFLPCFQIKEDLFNRQCQP